MDADERYRLFSKVLDGEASSEERASLDSLLKSDPSAAEEWRRWVEVDDMLSSAPAIETPPYLYQSIVDRIHAVKASRSRAERTVFAFTVFYFISALMALVYFASHLDSLFIAFWIGVRVVVDMGIILHIFYLLGKSLFGVAWTEVGVVVAFSAIVCLVACFAFLSFGRKSLGKILAGS